jgi:hypothetical protein
MLTEYLRCLQPARIIVNSGNSPPDPTDQLQLQGICASNFLSSFFADKPTGGKFSGYLHQSALYGSKITDE